jgi:hypothetical protein
MSHVVWVVVDATRGVVGRGVLSSLTPLDPGAWQMLGRQSSRAAELEEQVAALEKKGKDVRGGTSCRGRGPLWMNSPQLSVIRSFVVDRLWEVMRGAHLVGRS